MKLIQSFPKLSDDLLVKLEGLLKDKFDYPSIPQDYKDFLLLNNGGYVIPGYAEDIGDTEHTESVVFETPLKWSKSNDAQVKPGLVFFFGVWLPDDMDINEVENTGLYDLIGSNEYSKYDLDILPDRMMSIAKCSHPDVADMLCISVAEEDFGSVYFYYGMWYFPAKWHGSYYDDKKAEILQRYNIKDSNDIDKDTSEGKKIINELNRVPFVKVADSFAQFLENCKVISNDID